jgi:hypothetical protein
MTQRQKNFHLAAAWASPVIPVAILSALVHFLLVGPHPANVLLPDLDAAALWLAMLCGLAGLLCRVVGSFAARENVVLLMPLVTFGIAFNLYVVVGSFLLLFFPRFPN